MRSLPDQAERLVALGAHELAGVPATELRVVARSRRARGGAGAAHRVARRAGAAARARRPARLRGHRHDRRRRVHRDRRRGPAGRPALPAIAAAGRTPLTLGEGLCWLLQEPGVLERNHCFMTIGTRRRRPGGRLDARTPAIWISNGTGRDGADRLDAPKVGWCWAGNRHTWLGFASAAGRAPVS